MQVHIQTESHLPPALAMAKAMGHYPTTQPTTPARPATGEAPATQPNTFYLWAAGFDAIKGAWQIQIGKRFAWVRMTHDALDALYWISGCQTVAEFQTRKQNSGFNIPQAQAVQWFQKYAPDLAAEVQA